jgi:hypothetical protein
MHLEERHAPALAVIEDGEIVCGQVRDGGAPGAGHDIHFHEPRGGAEDGRFDLGGLSQQRYGRAEQ